MCCRSPGLSDPLRRQVYLTDDTDNLAIDTVLADVLDTIAAFHAEDRKVLVHCHAGASRSGLILRAWLRRTRGLDPAEATGEAQRLWPATATWNPSFDDALARVNPGPEADRG